MKVIAFLSMGLYLFLQVAWEGCYWEPLQTKLRLLLSFTAQVIQTRRQFLKGMFILVHPLIQGCGNPGSSVTMRGFPVRLPTSVPSYALIPLLLAFGLDKQDEKCLAQQVPTGLGQAVACISFGLGSSNSILGRTLFPVFVSEMYIGPFSYCRWEAAWVTHLPFQEVTWDAFLHYRPPSLSSHRLEFPCVLMAILKAKSRARRGWICK